MSKETYKKWQEARLRERGGLSSIPTYIPINNISRRLYTYTYNIYAVETGHSALRVGRRCVRLVYEALSY